MTSSRQSELARRRPGAGTDDPGRKPQLRPRRAIHRGGRRRDSQGRTAVPHARQHRAPRTRRARSVAPSRRRSDPARVPGHRTGPIPRRRRRRDARPATRFTPPGQWHWHGVPPATTSSLYGKPRRRCAETEWSDHLTAAPPMRPQRSRQTRRPRADGGQPDLRCGTSTYRFARWPGRLRLLAEHFR